MRRGPPQTPRSRSIPEGPRAGTVPEGVLRGQVQGALWGLVLVLVMATACQAGRQHFHLPGCLSSICRRRSRANQALGRFAVSDACKRQTAADANDRQRARLWPVGGWRWPVCVRRRSLWPTTLQPAANEFCGLFTSFLSFIPTTSGTAVQHRTHTATRRSAREPRARRVARSSRRNQSLCKHGVCQFVCCFMKGDNGRDGAKWKRCFHKIHDIDARSYETTRGHHRICT